MANPRSRYKICSATQKRGYRTEDDARLSLLKLSQNPLTRRVYSLSIYRCKDCGLLHVGHNQRAIEEIKKLKPAAAPPSRHAGRNS